MDRKYPESGAAYEVDAMKKIREVFEAKVSIEDVILMRVMRSFEGKSKTIQHKIADDINSPEGITEDTNVFDKKNCHFEVEIAHQTVHINLF